MTPTLKEIAEKSGYRKTTIGVYDGYDVFKWPEFIALCLRLGVPLDLDCTEMTIRIADGERPKIVVEFGSREPNLNTPIDTTTCHNERYRTMVPPSRVPSHPSGTDVDTPKIVT